MLIGHGFGAQDILHRTSGLWLVTVDPCSKQPAPNIVR